MNRAGLLAQLDADLAERERNIARLAAYEAADLMFDCLVRKGPYRTGAQIADEAVKRALDAASVDMLDARIAWHEHDPDEATEERLNR